MFWGFLDHETTQPIQDCKSFIVVKLNEWLWGGFIWLEYIKLDLLNCFDNSFCRETIQPPANIISNSKVGLLGTINY